MVKFGSAALTAFLICYAAWVGEPTWAAMALMAGVCGLSLQLLLRRRSPVSWGVATVAFYFMYFCVHPFIGSQILNNPEDPLRHAQVASALVWAAAGIAVFTTASLYSFGLASRRSYAEAPLVSGPFVVLQDMRVLALFVAVGGGGIAYTIVNGYFGLGVKIDSDENLSGLAIVAWTFFDVAFSIAWIHYFATKKSRWLAFAIPLLLIYGGAALFARSKGAFMLPLLVVAGAYLLVRQRLPLVWILAGIVFYVGFAYPYVTTWRQTGRSQYHTRMEMAEEGFALLQSGDWIGTTDNSEAKDATLSLGRNLLAVFSIIVSRTGVGTAPEGGATYLTAFGVMVPRVLWKDKPATSLGNMVGHKYNLIADEDNITNISPTLMGEMYMNFEGVGILLGMLVLGILAGIIDAKAGGWFGRWFYVWSWPSSLLGQEGVVAHLAPGFIKGFVAVAAVCVLLRAIVQGNMLPNRAASRNRRFARQPARSHA